MNNFIAIARFSSIPDLRYTGDNQTAITNPTIELMTRYGTGETFSINSVAWGKVAEQVASMKDGAIALVSGQLNVLRVDRGDFKESIASFKIAEVIMTLDHLIPFNQISILGNVGQAVDSRYFDSGKNKASFSLAVRRTKEETDWFAIELWGDSAKVAEKYVEKGSKVGVTGHLKLESWTDKNTGEVRTKPVIVGDRIELAGKNGSESIGETSQSTYQKAPLATSYSTPSEAKEPDFDDIPF